jgi:hypothetical protein
MKFTLNSDHAVTLILDAAELASINDALNTWVALATFPRHSADRLDPADHERASELEKVTFEAYSQLQDQLDAAKIQLPPPRSEVGDMLFNS